MKNLKHLFPLLTIFITLVIAACSGSVKGKWSEEDRRSFYADMEAVEELDNFGDRRKDFIECYLNKAEANYSSYFLADLDEEGCEKLALECGQQVMDNESVIGNWTIEDKENFFDAMEKTEMLSVFGEDKQAFIICYLAKCEANYPSFFQADQDEEGCEALAIECIEELGLSGDI